MNGHRELRRTVRAVRRRWRLRRLLGGLAVFVFAAVVLALVAGFVVDASRFDPAVVTAVRVLAWLGLAAAFAKLVLGPLSRKVGDERVALYLEENEPTLGGRLVSALELGRGVGPDDGTDDGSDGLSPALVERLVRSAVERCRAVDGGRRVERRALWRSSALAAGALAFGVGLFLLGPAFLGHTTPLLLDPFEEAAARNPYEIIVEPGDVAVARGSDLEVGARLVNFDAGEADLLVRSAAGEWERWPMLREERGEDEGDGARFSLIVFDLQEATEYRVESSGVRSAVHRAEVVELPYVESLRTVWRYPAHTGLASVKHEVGDVAALVGTEVDVALSTTLPVPGGALEIEVEGAAAATVELVPGADGEWRGALTVGETPATWRVLLDGPDGRRIVGSADYFIDPLADQPPAVTFAKPGRDLRVSSLEEVVLEVEAADDHGVETVDLLFTRNGGAEESVRLYAARRRAEVAAVHTLYLEEYALEPGDLVAYWARARDGLGQEAFSDIYFLEIRPFERDLRQADSGGGGGMGVGAGELSGQQRMILSATFKLSRGTGGGDHGDDLVTVALSQGRLREQALALASQMTAAGGSSEVMAAAIALGEAAAEMEAAEEALGEERPDAALLPEQRALRLLQRAEAVFRELRVGQGGGSGAEEMSEELTDLLEAEMDRLRHQYESVARDQERSADQAVDEVLERLRELARRQQQENERRRARARQNGGGTGASGEAQRRLAEELEEEARRLERLARQESRPDLERIAHRLRAAAEDMRRAAADERAGEALGNAALERLREARRELDEEREGRLARDARRAAERLARLRQQQEGVLERVEDLDPADEAALRRLFETKERMGAEAADLESELDRLSREARREQPEASRRLQETAAFMRERQIREKILYSRGVAAERSSSYARRFEENIGQALEGVEERLDAAMAAIGESREARLGRVLESTRAAVTGLESLAERLRAAREEGGSSGSGVAPRQLRQLERALGERRAQLEDLRESLAGEDLDVAELDAVLERLRGLSGQLDDGEAANVLEGEIIASLAEFEYGLRRTLGLGAEERWLQAGTAEVPPGYEAMVERYFKALAEER